MQRVAVSWLVYRMTHSPAMLGLAAFAGQFPTFLLSPYAGVITDRYNRYKILMITQISSLIQASALAALVLAGHYTVAEIIGLSALLGVINAFDTPSRQSLIIELVDKREDLSNAIALNSFMVNMARLAGPAIAGILLASLGEGSCFLVNAFSFLAVIISLMMMKITPRAVTRHSQNALIEFRKGFAYLIHTQSLRTVIIMISLVSFVAMPYTTLLPVFAKDIFHGNAAVFGWLNGMSGLGALSGAFYLASLKSGKNLLRIISVTTFVFGLGLLFLSLSTHLGPALVFITLCGFGMMSQMASSNILIQTTVPDEMRGRILSFYVMSFRGMLPLGSFLVGYLARRIGTPETVTIEGVLCLVIALLFIFYLWRQRGPSNLPRENIPDLSQQ